MAMCVLRHGRALVLGVLVLDVAVEEPRGALDEEREKTELDLLAARGVAVHAASRAPIRGLTVAERDAALAAAREVGVL